MNPHLTEALAKITLIVESTEKEIKAVRSENDRLRTRLGMLGGGLPTRYALEKLRPGAGKESCRTCRSCDNYCHGPMDCDGAGEETCLVWTPRPENDSNGERKKLHAP